MASTALIFGLHCEYEVWQLVGVDGAFPFTARGLVPVPVLVYFCGRSLLNWASVLYSNWDTAMLDLTNWVFPTRCLFCRSNSLH